MRTTVDIDARLMEKVRVLAAQRRTTVKAVLNSALRAGLSAPSLAAPPRFRVQTHSLGKPRVDLTHAWRVLDAMEDEARFRKMQRED
jgi:hypothetical protein